MIQLRWVSYTCGSKERTLQFRVQSLTRATAWSDWQDVLTTFMKIQDDSAGKSCLNQAGDQPTTKE